MSLKLLQFDPNSALRSRASKRTTDGAVAAALLVEHLFPPQFLRLPGLEIAVAYRQAGNREHVGGDIIDVYRLLDGKTALSIADISGKGIKAAVDAAIIKYSMRAYASEGFVPSRVLCSLNRLYNEKNVNDGEESYVTAFFACFDPETSTLRYASAAHEPVAICEPGRPAYVLDVTAPMLAVFDERSDLFGESSINVKRGTLLVAATDGLVECRARSGDFFGMDRLLAIIDENRDAGVQDVLAALSAAAETFSEVEYEDDTAILVARFL
jgi:sigma-B regulation protein RsbU (phosphoserine phosphatase)